MKKLSFLAFFFMIISVASAQQGSKKNAKAIVKGRITDAKGNPIRNVKVVIGNTVFYASYVYAITDANGNYSTGVPAGSWKVSATIERSFAGKTYRFDLHPDNAEPFAGSSGAIRNFRWKISGAKPGGGFYGSNIAVYSEPGSSFLMDDVEITLAPDGVLIDGNTAGPITKGLVDIGGGEDGINDIPIGKYVITAKRKSTGNTLQVRLRNKGSYADSLVAVFDAGFTGTTNYQVAIQVQEK